jgi:hypothetical protein
MNAQVLLRIEPPKKTISNYLRFFLVVVFFIFSLAMLATVPGTLRQLSALLPLALLYLLLLLVVGFFFVRLKPRSLVFTEKGITDGLFITALWEELEFYTFGRFKDIGWKNPKNILMLRSNNPPFYQLRFLGLPRDLYDRGLFLSDDEKTRAEEIFKAKGISKEP